MNEVTNQPKAKIEKCSLFPNKTEMSIINDMQIILKGHGIKFTKQNFGRGTKIFCKDGFTRMTFHIYNIEDKYLKGSEKASN